MFLVYMHELDNLMEENSLQNQMTHGKVISKRM